MGKTYKRNDRWKKDRRDHSFRNSKKFKDFKGNHPHHKPMPQSAPSDPLESLNDDTI